MSMKDIQITTDELNFFKEFYREEPHDWVNPFDISVNDWPPPEDWLKEKGKNKHPKFIRFSTTKIRR